MIARKRGRSALSRHLAERYAQRDLPDASAAPIEERPVTQVEPAPEPKPARKRRLVRPVPAALEPVLSEPAVVAETAPVPESTKPTKASKAPGKANWRDLAGTPIKVVKPSKLDAYVDKIGVVSDAEVARMAGVTPTNVQLWRRRRGIPPAKVGKAASPVAEPSVALVKQKPAPLVVVEAPVTVESSAPVEAPAPEPVAAPLSTKPSKLDPFVDKIGVLSDAEVASLAGVTRDAVWIWRKRRGIPPAKVVKTAPPVVEAPASVEPAATPVQPEPLVAPEKIEFAPVVFTEAPVPVEKVAPAPIPEPAAAGAPIAIPAPEVEQPPVPVTVDQVEPAPVAAKKRGRPSKVDQFMDKLGVMPDADLAALAGVAATTVERWRKVKGIAEPVARIPEPRTRHEVEVPVPVTAPPQVDPVVEVVVEPAVVEPVAVQLVGKPEISTPIGTNERTVRLTDRVEGMLQALARLRGIAPDAAISVAIAQDYLRCQAIIRAE